MKQYQHAMLDTLWYKKHFLSSILIPFSYLFCGVSAARRLAYQLKIKSTTHFNVPIIVVGNITVGGSGKTPFVVWLADFLKAQGLRPGIVSRGYGGKSARYPLQVMADSDPNVAGDEAILIVQKTACPMVVAPDRVAAVQYLLNDQPCDVIISDDGLQHYALGRDIEIVIIDGVRRLGNGRCLPAGPLRESANRLQKVDWIVTNGGAPRVGEYSMQLIPTELHNLLNPNLTLSLSELRDKTVHAVAGIGNPQRFFHMLRENGLNILEHPLPDHHTFTQKDIDFGNDVITVMTEKDAVKCQNLATVNCWYLPVKCELPAELEKVILKKLHSLQKRG